MAALRFFFATMNSGKSALALQYAHTYTRQGRTGLLLTRLSRGGPGVVSSRTGISAPAIEIVDDTDLFTLVTEHPGPKIDHIVVDEAQFLTGRHVEQLDLLVEDGVDVFAFGLATNFRTRLFPGAARLFALADEVHPLPGHTLCWCGQRGQRNTRVVDGVVARDGDQVVPGDVDTGQDVTYTVLCRRHYRSGQYEPAQHLAAAA